MKKRMIKAVLAGVFPLCLNPSAWAADTLYFAPLPMEQPEEVVKQFKPMLSYLERQLGVNIEIRYSSSYEEVLKKFQQGQVDFAYLGPLPYIVLRDQYPDAIPLVHFLEKSGKPTYTCALISAGESLPSGVKARKFALTQALSTCGYLSTDGLLHRSNSGLEQNKFRYLGKHDEVALAVARGDFDFGGLKTAIAKNYEGLGVKILAETAPLPSFALIANGKRLSPARAEAMRQALVRLKAEGPEKAVLAEWGASIRYGSVEAKDADFDVVRQLRRKAEIPSSGNF